MCILGGCVRCPECAKDRHGSHSAAINIDLSVWKSSAGWFATAGNRPGVPRAPQARSVPRRAPLGPWYTRDARWGTTVNLRARGWSTESYIRGCDRELTLSHPLPDSHRDYPRRAKKRSRSRGPAIHQSRSIDDSSTVWFTRGRSWYSWVWIPILRIANFRAYRVIGERLMIAEHNLCLIFQDHRGLFHLVCSLILKLISRESVKRKRAVSIGFSNLISCDVFSWYKNKLLAFYSCSINKEDK